MSAAVRAAEAADKIVELQAKRESLAASATAHEQQARAERLEMAEVKKQIAEWTTALNSLQVRQAVEDARAAAVASKASAETHEQRAAESLAAIERMREDMAALLLQAKQREEAAGAAATPAPEQQQAG